MQGFFDVLDQLRSAQSDTLVKLALTQRMGDSHAALLVAGADQREAAGVDRAIDAIHIVHAAFLEAIERVLGAPERCLRRADTEAVAGRLTALPESRAGRRSRAAGTR